MGDESGVYVATNRHGGKTPKAFHESPDCVVFKQHGATPVGPFDRDHPRCVGKKACSICLGPRAPQKDTHTSPALEALKRLAERGGELPKSGP